MVYKWARGAHVPLDANIAGTALEALAEKHKTLTPRLVVDEARPDDAPLHPAFEWNDITAAEAYRENQARHMLRSITVVRVKDGEEQAPIRAYVNVTVTTQPDTEQRVYMDTTAAMSDKDTRKQVLETALRELKAFRKKYAQLQELAKVFAAIDAIPNLDSVDDTNEGEN